MKVVNYQYPKSSFLSLEKDLSIIIEQILKNNRLKNLLFYTTSDCQEKPKLTEDESLSLFGNQIKIIPKVEIDGSVLNYLIITFDDFTTNKDNPQFRDNVIEFTILCHFNQWQLKDFQLRPYRIAAELDTLFDNKRLTGIGQLKFVNAMRVNTDGEYGGVRIMYKAIHGEEDKKDALNPADTIAYEANFNKIFNEKDE